MLSDHQTRSQSQYEIWIYKVDNIQITFSHELRHVINCAGFIPNKIIDIVLDKVFVYFYRKPPLASI